MSAIGDRPPDAGTRGFTLFEMLVALGIMALISGIAFPALQSAMGRATLAQAHDIVWLALSGARADARRRDAAETVTLAADGIRILAGDGREVALPTGIAVAWPARGIIFYPDGTATGGTIELRGAAGASRIAIEPGTARIGDAT